MFEILKNMFQAGKILEAKIILAFQKGWITEEQKFIILGK